MKHQTTPAVRDRAVPLLAQHAPAHASAVAESPPWNPAHRSAWWVLLLTVSVAIVAGTLAPFSLTRPLAGPSRWYGWADIAWPPSPPSDIILNVLGYIPFGLLLTRVIPPTRRKTIGTMTIVFFFCGATLSAVLEWLQTMIPVRCPSWIDVGANVSGTGVGVGLGWAVFRPGGLAQHARTLVRQAPWSTAAKVMTVGLILYYLLPFDFVSDSRDLWHSLARVRLLPTIPAELTGHEAVGALGRRIVEAVPFAVLGALMIGAQRERGRSRRQAWSTAAASVALTAFVVELAQIFVSSHACDLLDWVTASVAGIGGVAYAANLPGVWGGTSPRSDRGSHHVVLVAAASIYVAALLAAATTPHDFSWNHLEVSRLSLGPLAFLAARPNPAALAAVAESLLRYAVLAALLRGTLRSHASRWTAAYPILVVVAVVAACETLKLFTSTRYGDVTEPLLAVAAACFVAGVWPRQARTPAPPVGCAATNRGFRARVSRS